MRRLIYRSRSVDAVAIEDLGGLLSDARARNRVSGISGMLLYGGGMFLQLIEGPAEEVEALFSVISGDARHADACVLRRDEVAERMFPDRALAFEPMGGDPATVPATPHADLTWMSDGDVAVSLFDQMATLRSGPVDGDDCAALETNGRPS